MEFTLASKGKASVLKQVTNSSTVAFDIPMQLNDLKTLVVDLLMSPDKRDIIRDGVMVDRNQTAIRISVGSGSFAIPYANVFPLVN